MLLALLIIFQTKCHIKTVEYRFTFNYLKINKLKRNQKIKKELIKTQCHDKMAKISHFDTHLINYKPVEN